MNQSNSIILASTQEKTLKFYFNGGEKTFILSKEQRYVIGYDLENNVITVCRDFTPIGKPIDVEIIHALS